MTVNLLTEHILEFLSLKGGFTGSSEPTLVKMPHCWKLHVATSLYASYEQHRHLKYCAHAPSDRHYTIIDL